MFFMRRVRSPHPQPASHSQKTLWEKGGKIKNSPLHLWRDRRMLFMRRVRSPHPQPVSHSQKTLWEKGEKQEQKEREKC